MTTPRRGSSISSRHSTWIPTFALARAELSRAYADEANYGWTPLTEGIGRAREAVARALSLEPDLAEAHAAWAASRLIFDWDWRGAEASYAGRWSWRREMLGAWPGRLLAVNLGRFDEAMGLYRRAIEQDPLSAGAYHNLGNALNAAGRLAEAEQAYRKALELSPQQVMTRYFSR